LELMQRASLTYPIDLAVLALCTKPAERIAKLTEFVPGWVWEGVMVGVGMTVKQCMARYWVLVKYTLVASSSTARPNLPPTTKHEHLSASTAEKPKCVYYEYKDKMATVDMYPWAGERAVNVQEMHSIANINTTSLYAVWAFSKNRERYAQKAYADASKMVKQTKALTTEQQVDLHRRMYQYFANAMPGLTCAFNVQNCSEVSALFVVFLVILMNY